MSDRAEKGPDKRPDKGRKTTIVWMLATGLVCGLLVWRIMGGGEPPVQSGADAPGAHHGPHGEPATGDGSSASSGATPVAGGIRARVGSAAQPAVRPTTGSPAGVQVRGEPEKLPGAWVDVPARGGTAAVRVLALHGRGDTAANFARLARDFPGDVAWRFVEGPMPFSSGRRWFDVAAARDGRADFEPTFGMLRSHLDALDKPVILLGFSQGCMTILQLLATQPEGVRAAVCIGGNLVGAAGFSGKERPPVLFVTGARDTIVTAEKVRASIQRFEHAGGHTIPRDEVERIAGWMARKAAAGAP